MGFTTVIWLFAVAETLHNLEEAVMMPRWTPPHPKLRPRTGLREFRFAVVVLTIAVYVCAYLAMTGGKESVGAYLITGYALGALINVLAPHVAISMRFRCYSPGVVTAVLLILPVTVLLLRAAFRESWINSSIFLWAGPLVVLAMLASLPLLFAAGRVLFDKDIRNQPT